MSDEDEGVDGADRDAQGSAGDERHPTWSQPPARADEGPGDKPDMTRERARTERRDVDKERGEPVAG
ncbi:MAG: hypothetical protein M3Q66_03390, partial [Chloroflexota bacterium]|nr:hypothetical protein [Chloroflexota bacterium]